MSLSDFPKEGDGVAANAAKASLRAEAGSATGGETAVDVALLVAVYAITVVTEAACLNRLDRRAGTSLPWLLIFVPNNVLFG